jgi:hypothetical protein
MSSSDYRDYENGIADVLASIVGPDASVERNVNLPSRSYEGTRQIDVFVSGRVFGLTNGTLIVDAKRWRNTVDVPDIEAFISMVEDVGADLGMLIAATRASSNAQQRAQSARGVRVISISVTELAAWRPRGTVTYAIRVDEQDLHEAIRVLRHAGLRAIEDRGRTSGCPGQTVIETFRHYGIDNPSSEVQHGQREVIDSVLTAAGINYTNVSNGVVVNGGTPAHRWLNLTLRGYTLDLKVLAASEADIREQIEHIAPHLGLPPHELDVQRPDGWPFTSPFDI